jgi:hypothetical protein
MNVGIRVFLGGFLLLCISQAFKAEYFANKGFKSSFFYANARNWPSPHARFWRIALEWLCTASTSAVTCSGGVYWLMP